VELDGVKKALIMREIDEESVSNFLEKGNALAACDVAAFVYDISDAVSWKRAVELLVQVAAHGETNGFEVPCLLIAAKDDLEPDPAIIQSSAQVPIPFIQWLFIGL
jgi:Ras family protein T1